MAAQIDVSKLPNETLASLYKQLEAEEEALNRTLPVINEGLVICNEAIESVKSLQGTKQDNEALVPFTESCYIYVEVVDSDKFLVNIGGGYCAEFSKDDAIKFFANRQENRKAELNKVREALGYNQMTKEQIEIEVRGREAAEKAREAEIKVE